MNALTAAKIGNVEHAPAGLEDRLLWLMKFGKPRLGIYSQGWSANIEMNTNTTGTSFDVKSNFNHATPSEAVAVLIERMLGALATLTKDTP